MSDLTSKQKLIDDLKIVISDAEVVLKETAGQLGDKASAARLKLEEGIKVAKVRLNEADKIVREKARIATDATDKYIHDNPYKAIGTGFAIGLIIGLLIRGRD
ncbi:MAG: DUF883 family protein [Verrucomicrobiota bacterium]|nr:DUF883 family protein [Verrucomicrobiota bacterium]